MEVIETVALFVFRHHTDSKETCGSSYLDRNLAVKSGGNQGLGV